MACGVSCTRLSIDGVICMQPVGMPLAGTTISLPLPTAAASAARLGWLNNTRTSALRPTWRMRSIRLTASNECPPNSKK